MAVGGLHQEDGCEHARWVTNMGVNMVHYAETIRTPRTGEPIKVKRASY